MRVMVMRLSEPLGPQQSVGEVEQQPRGHEGGERIVENHGSLLKACRKRRRSPRTARKSRARGPARSGPTFGCSFRHAVPGGHLMAPLPMRIDKRQKREAVLARSNCRPVRATLTWHSSPYDFEMEARPTL